MARTSQHARRGADSKLAAALLGVLALGLVTAAALGLDPAALLLVVAVVLAGVAALWAWWSQRALAARAHEELRERTSAAEDTRKRMASELTRREEALAHARTLMARLQRSREAERQFNRDLRAQLERLHKRGADQVDPGDVHDLILRTAIELVEAKKGLMLSREDSNGDGDLDLMRSHGFEHDPADGVVAQRFAREALGADEILREDAPTGGGEGRTPADEEIECMVGIPVYLHDRFQGVVICANRDGGFGDLDDDLLLALGDHAGASLQTERLHREAGDARRTAVRMLAEAAHARDPLLRRSAGRVVAHARVLAQRLELDPEEEESLVCAALLRDVGNLAITERLFAKPGPLTPEERAVIELHPRIGFDIVGRMPTLRHAAFAVLYHHERYDGRGYPAGLEGERIPRLARVLAVVDAYDAMTHDRPHRPGLPPADALAEMIEESGRQFDPEITQLFVEELGRSRALTEPTAEAVAELSPLQPSEAGEPLEHDPLATLADALTLLGGHRTFHEAARTAALAATLERPAAVVLIELEDLIRINRRDGYAAGDRVIQIAAGAARRAAVAVGAEAFRESGRRFALLAPAADAATLRRLEREVHAEFALGPAVRIASAAWQPGDTGEDLVDRARMALRLPSSAPAD